ncbi:MAG: EF-Tu/IF-2/RF-3 family GTPase [Thermoplasmatota archaeon]
MPGVTAALLGNLDVRREFGKVGTQSDIHLHDFKTGDLDVTVIVPDRYPDKLQSLSYALTGSDAAILVVPELNARVGEQILAADAAGIAHGAIVLQNYLQPEQIQPLLAGTSLEGWKLFTEEDWPAVREHMATIPSTPKEGAAMVPVDHHFNVKGVGAVVLGVVKQGEVKKNDSLVAHPAGVLCPVRSIQVHDVDVPTAVTGDRVGLALRNTDADKLDRGMVLALADAPLESLAVGAQVTFKLRRSPFSKQPLAAGSVVHLGLGMQLVPLRLEADAPGAGQEGTVTGTLEKGLVHAPGDQGILWHMDSAPQRVVGRVAFNE